MRDTFSKLIAAFLLGGVTVSAAAQDEPADQLPFDPPPFDENAPPADESGIDDFFGPIDAPPDRRSSADRRSRPPMPGMVGYPPIQMGPFDNEVCGKQSLASTLAGSDAWYTVMSYKRRTGFLPAPVFRKRIRDRIQRDTESLTTALQKYSVRTPTYALIYGQKEQSGCVWLVGADGIRASGPAIYHQEQVTEQVWAGLDVEARSRGVRSQRTIGRDCPTYTRQPMIGPSQAFLKVAYEEMAFAAESLLPRDVARELADIPGNQNRLLILPSGNLRKLPFAALPIGDGLLIEKFAPVVIPSLSALEQSNPVAPQDGARLVIGNPDLSADPEQCWIPLPGAEREAENTAAKLGEAMLLTRGEADRKTVFDQLQSDETLGMVYLATHGVSDPENPADGSFLALKDGHLRGADLRTLKLVGNPLVVMSACQTGLGKEFSEGVFGLPEAWHFAGSNRIVMSLWNVSDAGTELLMGHFVNALADNEWQDADMALAAAMRQTYAETRDPMIWAAFVYFGVPQG